MVSTGSTNGVSRLAPLAPQPTRRWLRCPSAQREGLETSAPGRRRRWLSLSKPRSPTHGPQRVRADGFDRLNQRGFEARSARTSTNETLVEVPERAARGPRNLRTRTQTTLVELVETTVTDARTSARACGWFRQAQPTGFRGSLRSHLNQRWVVSTGSTNGSGYEAGNSRSSARS